MRSLKKVLRRKKSPKPLIPSIDMSQLDVPEDLLDCIDCELLADPVITPYGHIYSNHCICKHLSEVSTDPLTNQPLRLNELVRAPQEVINIIEQFKKLQIYTITRSNMYPNESLALLNKYHHSSSQLNKDMETLREKLIVQAGINMIKNNLKIDLDNPNHLNFWQKNCRKKIHSDVAKLMEIANREYNTTEDFVVAINNARKRTCCCRFFNFGQRNKLVNSGLDIRKLIIQ